jgi:hypothetical protein
MKHNKNKFTSIHLIIFVITMTLAFVTACQPKRGKPGVNGTNGLSCSVSTIAPSEVTPNGASLISCENGTSSLVLNGTNGIDGTLITAVQFCSGTGVYPSVFPEVGFVIGGHLYAVYSANGGYLFEVLPGRYSSNAIGNSCSFTVNADLTVSH